MKEETTRIREEKLKKIEYIKKRLAERAKKQDIAEELGCKPNGISKLISFARKNGLMEPKRTKDDLISEIKRRYEKELKSIKEIAEIMHYSINNIYLLIGTAREQGIWFTEEEEKEIQAKRKAKNKENSEENVSTTAISEFLDILIKKFKSGETIPPEDIRKILNYYSSHPDRISNSGLKLLLLNSYRQRRERGLIKMVIVLRKIISESEMKNNLETYSKALYILIMKQRIKELKEQGWNNTQIGEKLSLSSAEVGELYAKPDPTVFSDFR